MMLLISFFILLISILLLFACGRSMSDIVYLVDVGE